MEIIPLSQLMEAPPSWFTHIVLVTNQLLFSLMHIVAHPALEYFPPRVFSFFRISIGLPFIAFIVRKEWEFFRTIRLPQDLVWIVPVAVLGVTIPQYLIFVGNHMAGAGMAAAVQPTVPIDTAILSAVFGQEVLNLRMAAGIMIAVGGTLLLLGVEKLQFTSDKTLGILILLFQSLSYAGFLVLVKVLLKKYPHPMCLFFLASVAGWLILLPATIPLLLEIDWANVPFQVWRAEIFCGIGVSCFAHVMNTWAVHHSPPTVPALYGCLQPVMGVGLAVVFLGEHFGLRDGVSILCIIVGLVVVTYGRMKPNGSSDQYERIDEVDEENASRTKEDSKSVERNCEHLPCKNSKAVEATEEATYASQEGIEMVSQVSITLKASVSDTLIGPCKITV